MGNMFLFALIVAIASALVLIPIYQIDKTGNKKGGNHSASEDRRFIPGAIIAVLVILIPSVFAYYYFTNFDRNLSTLWRYALL